MSSIIVPLEDFVVDPENPIDLTKLSEAEAIERVKQSFDFLSSVVDVKLRDGVLTIALPEEKGKRAQEALDWFEHGNRFAQRGEYKRAINLFEKTINRLPNHVEARRNLAMAHLENGDVDLAKDLIVQALKIDPKDTWSYVLLGNIYAKHKRDFDRAEKWYRRAIEINPKDAILLTNFGAVMMERGYLEQAAEFFERAIASDSQYPNSYYALATLHLKERKNQEALRALDDLFNHSKPMDMRSNPLYTDARKLYFELAGYVAQGDYDRNMQLVEERRNKIVDDTSIPIVITASEDIEVVKAVTQLAWNHHRPEHRILYRQLGRAFVPYILAHELTHIRMEYEARAANRNRSFATTNETRERMIRSISDDVYKLRNRGYSESDITKVTLDWIKGLANQLFNMPLDIVIEARLYDELPELRPSQFIALSGFATDNAKGLTNAEIKRLTPTRIWRASVAMSGAYALLMDSLYPGRAEFAKPYRQWEHFSLVEKLYHVWQDLRRDWEPGDEYDLVDEFAHILKLQDIYEWKPANELAIDTTAMPLLNLAEDQFTEQDLSTTPQGSTNPELLKEKEPATIMYLLGGLQRFDRMTEAEIQQVAMETGVIGMEGIDYASADKKYTLKAFPGETFSGLQLLAFMYLGFKRIDPTLNSGLDFDDAYRIALQMHHAQKD